MKTEIPKYYGRDYTEAQAIRRSQIPNNVYCTLASYFWRKFEIDDNDWLDLSNNDILEFLEQNSVTTVYGVGEKREKDVYDFLGGTLKPKPIVKRKTYIRNGWRITVTKTKLEDN